VQAATQPRCPDWCVVGGTHGVHESTRIVMPRDAGKWNVSARHADGAAAPYLSVVYIGEERQADTSWHISLDAVAEWARFASRLDDAQLAGAMTAVADRAGELVTT
jgi:hypothetical protein